MSLKDLRYSRGMSQRDLAKSAGISVAAVTQIEKGKHKPWPQTLRKLAECLQVPVSDLAAIINQKGD